MTTQKYDIESTANDRLKSWLALGKRSQRDKTRSFLIEGRRESERAQDHIEITEFIWCPDLDAVPPDTDSGITTVSLRVFEKLSHRQNPDGVAAVARTPDLSMSAFDPAATPLVLVADGVEKPGNIGAMLRTCDTFAAAFIGSDLGTDLVNPNVVRSAQGSLFSVPVASASRDEVIAWCTANTDIVVAHPAGERSLWQTDFVGPTTIVVGAEHEGVHMRWLDVGTAVTIPMSGIADSLNVSVSAGVFLAEGTRQRLHG